MILLSPIYYVSCGTVYHQILLRVTHSHGSVENLKHFSLGTLILSLYFALAFSCCVLFSFYIGHVKNPWCNAVFSNLFFEAEHLTAILIVHGTHGHSQELDFGLLLRPKGPKFEAKSGEGVLSNGAASPKRALYAP